MEKEQDIRLSDILEAKQELEKTINSEVKKLQTRFGCNVELIPISLDDKANLGEQKLIAIRVKIRI